MGLHQAVVALKFAFFPPATLLVEHLQREQNVVLIYFCSEEMFFYLYISI